MQSTAVLTLLDAHTTAGREAASPEAALATLAALRNLALTLIRRAGHTAIAAYRRHLSTHPAKALRLLHPKTRAHR